MNGRTVFVQAVRRVREVVQESLDANGLKASDVDLYLFHQANLRIVDSVVEHFGISTDRTYNNIDRYGNTAAASVAICLHQALAADPDLEGLRARTAALCEARPLYPGFRGFPTYVAEG